MTIILRPQLATLVSLVLFFDASPAVAQRSADALVAVDSIVRREMRERRIPGVAVAAVRDGRVVLQRAYGTANMETDTPMRPAAVFELASITKQFTAALIMLLVEEGKVSLNDSISRYIDSTPMSWAPITVRHLLTHTAGLEIASMPRIGGSAPLNVSTRAAFDNVARQPLRSSVGQQGWYSDGGYLLLGMIVERTSGESYRAALQRRIFDPLGMTNSSVLDKSRVLRGRVPTYALRDTTLVHWRRDWDHELPSFFGIFSTLDDLVKWDAALRGTGFLRATSLKEMWSPARVNDGQQARVLDHYYGLGFELADLRGHRTVAHGGASGTYMLRLLDEPLTVIVLSNLENPSGRRHPVRLARAIAGVLLPELVPPEMLVPQQDPLPDGTRAVDSLLAAIATDREPANLSDGFRRWWSAAHGRRALARNQLRGVTPVVYVGRDRVAGRPLWETEALEELVYYKTTAGDRTLSVTVGLTRDGRVARLDIPLQ